MLSRIIHGARISLLVGVAAVVVSLAVGVTAGLVSGFVGGKVDTVIGTVVDVTLSFPQILLALAFVAALGPSLVTIIVVLGLTGWERYTRVVRAEVLALREKEFVEAARAIGVGRLRIVFRHVLPNTTSSIVVLSTLQVAQTILAEAALSFLGVGSGSAYPTWGQMISLGRDFVTVAWWLPTLPGLAILLTVLAINLVGDRLRDALDPRIGDRHRRGRTPHTGRGKARRCFSILHVSPNAVQRASPKASAVSAMVPRAARRSAPRSGRASSDPSTSAAR